MRAWIQRTLLLCTLLPLQLQAAVSYDAYSEANFYASAGISWTHTPAGTVRGVIVWVFEANESSSTVTGVTYGGEAMTEVALSPVEKSSGETASVRVYKLESVPGGVQTGAQTIAVSENSTTDHFYNAFAVSVSADADTTVVDTTVINSDATTNPSGTLTLGGETSFAAEAYFEGTGDPGTISALTDWTIRVQPDAVPFSHGLITYDTIGSSDVTIGYTQATTDDVLLFAVAIAEAAGSSPVIPVLHHQLRNQ